MAEKSSGQKGWRQFNRLKIDKKKLRHRARKIETATVKHAHRFLTRRWTNMREVGRHTAGWLLLIGLFIVLSTVQMGWFARGYTANTPESGGTYAEGVVGGLDTINPLFASTQAEVSAVKLIFSSLLSYDRDNRLKTDIASSWSVDESGKIYTVKLRDDIYWHDGEKLDVEDVMFTIRLIQNPAVKALQYGMLAGVKVERISSKELRFVLPSVYAPFAHALTFGVLPEHLLKDVKSANIRENDFGRKPVGSGPFSFRQLQVIDPSKQRLVVHMEANGGYYGGRIRSNRFQLHTYENRDTLKRALVTSEVNSALGLGSNQISSIIKNGNFVASNSLLLDGMFAIFNTDQPALQDVQVRQAIMSGTSRQGVLSAVHGQGILLDGPLPRQSTSEEQAHISSFDVAAAGAKLDASGWKLVNGTRQKEGVKLELSLVAPNGGDYKILLDVLAKQWRELGIIIKTQLADTQTIASDYLQPRAYDVLLYEMSIGADADVYAYWHSSQANVKGLNFANYRSGVVDDALSSARSKLDPVLRSAKYKMFYEQWQKDAPAVPLYQPFISYTTTKNTTAIEEDSVLADISVRYRNVGRWSASKATVFKTR